MPYKLSSVQVQWKYFFGHIAFVYTMINSSFLYILYSVYIYIYIYICVCVCLYIYNIYIYIYIYIYINVQDINMGNKFYLKSTITGSPNYVSKST